MHPSDVAATVIASAVSVAIILGVPIAGGAAAVARLRGRRAAGLVAIALVLAGLIMGYGLLAEPIAGIRAASLLGVVVLVAIAVLVGRLSLAGLILIAAALPWTIYATGFLLDIVLAHRRLDPIVVLPPLIAALAGIVAGVSVIRFHRQYLTRHPEAAAPPPPPTARAFGAAGRAVLGPSVLGLNAAAGASAVVLVAGTQVTVMTGHGQPVLAAFAVVVIGAIATGLLAAAAWAVVWPPRSRRAFEAFAWLGEWELARFAALTEGRVAPTFANMKRYVRNTAERPEDRWVRVDVLAAAGKVDAAREMASRLPGDTPLARAERVDYLTYIDWLGGGPGDPTALRNAVAAIEPPDGDDHLRADVALALSEVRLRIAVGHPDPVAPMRDVRDRLGGRADRVTVASARRLAPGYLRVSTVFAVVVTLLDRAFTV
jgi:hypothetical protein